jgi:predicted RNA binding protein YcfA (HicA-like mRNA interferase family)
MKVREVIRILQDDGWIQVAQRGSHRQFKHLTKPGRVTVPGGPNDEVRVGTLSSILRQAGLKQTP